MSKKFNLRECSLDIGKASSFFGVLKKTNPALFRYCTFYSKRTLAEGYEKLNNYYLNLKLKVQKIFETFKHTYSFCQWLVKNDLYNSYGSAQSISCMFLLEERIRVDFLYKMKAIIKYWNKQND